MKKRFEIRRSPVDDMLRVWEHRQASTIMDPWGQPTFKTSSLIGRLSGDLALADWPVWVVTGVYRTRREIFKAREGDIQR